MIPCPEPVTSPHALQACWDMQLAGVGADALRVALECGLFAHLAGYASPGEVADRLALDAAGAGYVLELLWGMELVERDGAAPRYRNLPVAARYLDPASGQYCGDALLFRHRVVREVGAGLGDRLRTGAGRAANPDAAAARRAWAEAARTQIAQEQRAVTAEVAVGLLAALPEFRQATRLLDLGGGPGLVAIAAARAQPDLGGVVFEYEEAAAVAREHIAAAGLSRRLSAVGGDLATDALGEGFDLVWCSSVLHFVPDIPDVLDRVRRAMRPGGVLVCCHGELRAEARDAWRVLQYYLPLRMQGRHVLAEGELACCLARAGFIDIQRIDGVRFPVAPVTALIARKARGEGE
ncbi:methyltransferase [Pseudothauera rhizosphaerae]|uniref:Methyltransferase n=1 Tax=Pseudothauera rhizosphaerae TaxID=2565932 RepID=A0A4S4ANM0_9RHOO|nr:methyltransferase [Pseudothauera rhizosphaerae]THF61234.1 methyltransferase [Pseudothauera rhizosphaerae]